MIHNMTEDDYADKEEEQADVVERITAAEEEQAKQRLYRQGFHVTYSPNRDAVTIGKVLQDDPENWQAEVVGVYPTAWEAARRLLPYTPPTHDHTPERLARFGETAGRFGTALERFAAALLVALEEITEATDRLAVALGVEEEGEAR